MITQETVQELKQRCLNYLLAENENIDKYSYFYINLEEVDKVVVHLVDSNGYDYDDRTIFEIPYEILNADHTEMITQVEEQKRLAKLKKDKEEAERKKKYEAEQEVREKREYERLKQKFENQ